MCMEVKVLSVEKEGMARNKIEREILPCLSLFWDILENIAASNTFLLITHYSKAPDLYIYLFISICISLSICLSIHTCKSGQSIFYQGLL